MNINSSACVTYSLWSWSTGEEMCPKKHKTCRKSGAMLPRTTKAIKLTRMESKAITMMGMYTAGVLYKGKKKKFMTIFRCNSKHFKECFNASALLARLTISRYVRYQYPSSNDCRPFLLAFFRKESYLVVPFWDPPCIWVLLIRAPGHSCP